jgi:hypothetical protein
MIVPVLVSDWVAAPGTSVGNVWGSTFLASWVHEGGAVSSVLGVPLQQMGVACYNLPYLFKEMHVKIHQKSTNKKIMTMVNYN